MAVELRHLRYIIAVAEEGHITRAAERLGIAQPPLSRAIQEIEHRINVQLFRRMPRGVELTAAGRIFLDGARATLANLDRTLESAQRTARGEEGRISLGFTSSSAFHPLVPRVIREFRETFPRVTVRLVEESSSELIAHVKSDRIDAAFTRLIAVQHDGIDFHPFLEEPMVVALPKSHELAQGKASVMIALKQLSEETFVVNRQARQQPSGAGTRESFFAACHAAGFSPRVYQEAPNVIATLPLIAAGIGISILPSSLQHMNVAGVTFRRLAGNAPFKFSINLASRSGDVSPVVRQFVNTVRRKAKDHLNQR